MKRAVQKFVLLLIFCIASVNTAAAAVFPVVISDEANLVRNRNDQGNQDDQGNQNNQGNQDDQGNQNNQGGTQRPELPPVKPEYTPTPSPPPTEPEYTPAPSPPPVEPEYSPEPSPPPAEPEYTPTPYPPPAPPEYTPTQPSPPPGQPPSNANTQGNGDNSSLPLLSPPALPRSIAAQNTESAPYRYTAWIPQRLLESLERQRTEVLTVTAEGVSYVIPVRLSELIPQLDSTLRDHGVSLVDLYYKLTFEFLENDDSMPSHIRPVSKIVDFKMDLTDQSEQNLGEVEAFTEPIIRQLPIDKHLVNEPALLAGARFHPNEDFFEFVPHNIVQDGDDSYASIQSRRNGTYLAAENNTAFNDIDYHWGRVFISRAGHKFLVHGADNGQFDPEGTLSRSMFVQMIASSVDIPDAYSLLEGLPSSNWRLSPGETISREEMASVLAKIVSMYEDNITAPRLNIPTAFVYVDYLEAAPQYRDDLHTAVSYGLITGTSHNTLSPNSYVTRAQMAVIQNKLTDLLQLV